MPKDVSRKNGAARIKQRIQLGMLKGIIGWGELIAADASERAPVATGRLARSIHAGDPISISELLLAILVGTNVVYAHAHEFGSGIHAENPADRELIVIEAKNAAALAFFWPNGPKNISAFDSESGLHFFKRVFHPGVPAMPYLRPALANTAEEGRRLMMSAIGSELAQ